MDKAASRIRLRRCKRVVVQKLYKNRESVSIKKEAII